MSKLRRSDLFIENRPAQNAQLRRSGIFGPAQAGATAKCAKYANGFFSCISRISRLKSDAAPTELNNPLIAVATNMPLLWSYETAGYKQSKTNRKKLFSHVGGARILDVSLTPWLQPGANFPIAGTAKLG